MLTRSMLLIALTMSPMSAVAETEGVLLRCKADRVETHGGAFTQGVRHLEAPEVYFTLSVNPDNLVFRTHWAGAQSPSRGVQYQSATHFEEGILYRQRETDAQSEYARDNEYWRNELSIPFSLDSFTSFKMVWMCYENGCGVHTQMIEASCDSAIPIDGDVY